MKTFKYRYGTFYKKEKGVQYFIKKEGDGMWTTVFKIGVQAFSLQPTDSEDGAKWRADMLCNAFEKL